MMLGMLRKCTERAFSCVFVVVLKQIWKIPRIKEDIITGKS